MHFYKIKSHNGVIRNEGTDALALQAAKTPNMADASLNQAENLCFYLYWLFVGTTVGLRLFHRLLLVVSSYI
eukprot:1161499-Pelagomonas_calceolata.AAC.9